MKTIISAIAASILATASFAGGSVSPIAPIAPKVTPAFTGLYFGGGLTFPQTYLDGEKKFFTDDVYNETGLGIGGTVGYVVYNSGLVSVAVEGRGAISISKYDITEFDSDTYNYGVYVKPEVYVAGGKLGIYALGGYAKVVVEDNFDKEDQLGFAYGAGAEYFITDSISVFGDYTMLPEFDLDEAGQQINNDQFQAGINYRF